MRRNLFLMLSLALLGGCAQERTTATGPVRQVACDDGGSGGVMIDGVCL